VVTITVELAPDEAEFVAACRPDFIRRLVRAEMERTTDRQLIREGWTPECIDGLWRLRSPDGTLVTPAYGTNAQLRRSASASSTAGASSTGGSGSGEPS
jgi:hypothetical protein